MATAQTSSPKLSKKVKLKLRNLYLRYPKSVECNICGWSGRHLASDDWHPQTVCWKCRSLVRHRLLTAALHEIEGLTLKDLAVGKRVLHFAPERLTTPLFKPQSASYKTADFMRDDVDAQLDLTNMPSQGDASVDLLICCDVLEHVPDHMQGMARDFPRARSGRHRDHHRPSKRPSRKNRVGPQPYRSQGKTPPIWTGRSPPHFRQRHGKPSGVSRIQGESCRCERFPPRPCEKTRFIPARDVQASPGDELSPGVFCKKAAVIEGGSDHGCRHPFCPASHLNTNTFSPQMDTDLLREESQIQYEL